MTTSIHAKVQCSKTGKRPHSINDVVLKNEKVFERWVILTLFC